MSRLNEWWRGNKFRRIKYLAIVPASGVAASFQGKIRNQASLCNFLRSCVNLVELNLSAFHFGKDFKWSSMLANGGLDHIRSLALSACALCHPHHLSLLGRASFKLRELDVRFFPQIAPNCTICLLDTTCDDDALAPLRYLDSLERLTLCELYRVRNLRFLSGCASIRELRLRNLGVWCVGGDENVEPLVSIWPQLHVAKFERCHVFQPLQRILRHARRTHDEAPLSDWTHRLDRRRTGHRSSGPLLHAEGLPVARHGAPSRPLPGDGRGAHFFPEDFVSGGRRFAAP
ncbi:hypothetical protein HPB51_018116 [Rhipicephalus microplus]|uniref:Uncharacterized protein n=1 Tax=Rhipicephalus microplus TaxID=6941 RepID=A0A9J6E2X3_RHIMP|nr:hypothetical protein HPB51_018116 [Rhipicephalus microplus]